MEVTLLGIAYHIKNLGGGAFTVSDHVGAFADIPRDYVGISATSTGVLPGGLKTISMPYAKWMLKLLRSFMTGRPTTGARSS